MVRAFRTYHRWLAIAMALPLGLTILSGMGYTLFDEWLEIDGAGRWMMALHTGDIFGLEDIYPVLNGLGAVGLLITGLSMVRLRKRRRPLQDNL
ncbi:MAG: peptidase [Cyanobacteria bacterium]|nr:peptidase [Cyanobacteriota bacterium]